jgi:hypothetical protein
MRKSTKKLEAVAEPTPDPAVISHTAEGGSASASAPVTESEPELLGDDGPTVEFYEKVGENKYRRKSTLILSAVKPHLVEKYANNIEREGYELHRSDITSTGRYTLWFRFILP